MKPDAVKRAQVFEAEPASTQPVIYPVLLSGGTGSRLWPLSRQSYPKQLLALTGPRTLLQETALRADEDDLARLIVIGSAEHRFAIAEQLHGIGLGSARII